MSNQQLNATVVEPSCEDINSNHMMLEDVDTRDGTRRTLVLPLTAICVRPDGSLMNSSRTGFSKNVSSSGLEFEINGEQPLASAAAVVGIECPDDQTRFAGVTIRHTSRCEAGLRCGGEFGGPAHRMLEESSRMPTLNAKSFQFEMPFSDESYSSWEQAGIVKATVLDRILLCPKCGGVPTFRFACRSCGAGRLSHEVMIHHYACAYVGPATQFEESSQHTLVCPKCRTKNLVVGTDYEYAPGEYDCQSCGWKDRELEQTGHCLSCEHRFPIHQSVEQELVGYDAKRLDPLALIKNLG